MQPGMIKSLADRIRGNVQRVIIGRSNVIDVLIAALIAGGHALLEDVPGTGKTVMAKALSRSIDSDFKRVQFTPDLLPSDLTGINFYNQKQGEFVLREGPLFTDILLADEINRATPRTQSSLLECMEERQISIDGVTYPLGELFFVIATENPIEIAGTFPLPEAQLDRFLVRLHVGYPSFDESIRMIDRFVSQNPLAQIKPVCSVDEIVEAKNAFAGVYISPEIREYMVKIIEGTRSASSVKLGVSPRGMLALVKMCQAYASIKGREYVTADDVKDMSRYVLPHRIILKENVRVKGVSSEGIVERILSEVPSPTEDWKNSGRSAHDGKAENR